MHSVLLRTQLESALGSRTCSALVNLNQHVIESVSTGISNLDRLTGGLPRGAVTEITGPVSSGRTSIALSILAEATVRGEAVALIDGGDAFTPHSAAAAGVDLKRLLWVRCNHLDAVLKTADLLLKGGGFGVVAVDLTDFPVSRLQSVPLTTWFRFQRTIENTPTILVVTGQEPLAQSCAALVLRMEMHQPVWSGTPFPSHSILLSGNQVNAEAVRHRQSRQRSGSRYVRLHLHS